jgi:hypothetical protein
MILLHRASRSAGSSSSTTCGPGLIVLVVLHHIALVYGPIAQGRNTDHLSPMGGIEPILYQWRRKIPMLRMVPGDKKML